MQADMSYLSDMGEEEKLVGMLDNSTSLFSGMVDAYGSAEVEEARVSQGYKNLEFQVVKIISKRLERVHIYNLKKFTNMIEKGLKKLQRFQLKSRFLSWMKSINQSKSQNEDVLKEQLSTQEMVIKHLKEGNKKLNEEITEM